MGSVASIVMLELDEFRFQIGCGPEQGSVQELAPNCADESLHERMRQRDARNRLNFGHVEYAKIGLPLMESIQRIMIRAEVFRQSRPADGSLEHPAQRHSIHDSGVEAKPNEASTSTKTAGDIFAPSAPCGDSAKWQATKRSRNAGCVRGK